MLQLRRDIDTDTRCINTMQSWATSTAPAIQKHHDKRDVDEMALKRKWNELSVSRYACNTTVQLRRRRLVTDAFDQMFPLSPNESFVIDGTPMTDADLCRTLAELATHAAAVDRRPLRVWSTVAELIKCLVVITDSCVPYSQPPSTMLLADKHSVHSLGARIRRLQTNVAVLNAMFGSDSETPSAVNAALLLHNVHELYRLITNDKGPLHEGNYRLGAQTTAVGDAQSACDKWNEQPAQHPNVMASRHKHVQVLGCRHERVQPASIYGAQSDTADDDHKAHAGDWVDDWERVRWEQLPSGQAASLTASRIESVTSSLWGMLTTHLGSK